MKIIQIAIKVIAVIAVAIAVAIVVVIVVTAMMERSDNLKIRIIAPYPKLLVNCCTIEGALKLNYILNKFI